MRVRWSIQRGATSAQAAPRAAAVAGLLLASAFPAPAVRRGVGAATRPRVRPLAIGAAGTALCLLAACGKAPPPSPAASAKSAPTAAEVAAGDGGSRGGVDGGAAASPVASAGATAGRRLPSEVEAALLRDDEAEHAAAGAAALRQRPAAPSQSVGTPQDGVLRSGVVLREAPDGALRPLPHTHRRGWLFGTAELVALLQDAARAIRTTLLAQGEVALPLRIGNLSREGGGDIAPSRSHNSGRDADVAFFHVDREGRPVDADHYVRYDAQGVAEWPPAVAGRLYFDASRNWLFVRYLLSDPSAVVQWIFLAAPLRNMLLDYALRVGEPESLRLRALRVLVQPTDSSPHADHFHIRIACPGDDRPGCVDGPGRTAAARLAQIDALLSLYHHGSPAEQRYARDILSLPMSGEDIALPPDSESDHDDADAPPSAAQPPAIQAPAAAKQGVKP